MPNLTISVSEELKQDMDTLPEVNWSEICRNSISQYIAQRKAPSPGIELDLRMSTLTTYDYNTGYPTLNLEVKIRNNMDCEILVDRVLSTVSFLTDDHRVLVAGSADDFHRKYIAKNSSGGASLHTILSREKVDELKDVFKSTFDCSVRCTVYVEGFRNGYTQEVKTSIPIDTWNSVVRKVLDQMTKRSSTDTLMI
jgi:hypothetical protein